jgi:hypothetical protein
LDATNASVSTASLLHARRRWTAAANQRDSSKTNVRHSGRTVVTTTVAAASQVLHGWLMLHRRSRLQSAYVLLMMMMMMMLLLLLMLMLPMMMLLSQYGIASSYNAATQQRSLHMHHPSLPGKSRLNLLVVTVIVPW